MFRIAIVLTAMIFTGCASRPAPTQEQIDQRNQAIKADIDLSIAEFKRTDSTLQELFDTAYGYAVFPRVSKGGLVVGGSHGYGQVFQSGRIVGDASITKISLGLQVGGQVFRELIFFKNAETLARFKGGEFALSAEATAAAAADGVAASADYAEGAAVFVMPIKGLMIEAAIGGQKFSFTPSPQRVSVD